MRIHKYKYFDLISPGRTFKFYDFGNNFPKCLMYLVHLATSTVSKSVWSRPKAPFGELAALLCWYAPLACAIHFQSDLYPEILLVYATSSYRYLQGTLALQVSYAWGHYRPLTCDRLDIHQQWREEESLKISMYRNLPITSVKMHIPVQPCRLVPTHTWTLYGCLGL